MIKVAHIINSIDVGGAETMLVKLVTGSDRRMFTHRIYTLLSPPGSMMPIVTGAGVPVREIGINRALPNPLHLYRLAQWLRDDPPDIVQTWLYHSDIVGSLAAALARISAPVVWNIRNGSLDAAGTPVRTHWVVKACAWASGWSPRSIICCSHAARQIHAELGYDVRNFEIIPNGFDLNLFRPDPASRHGLRQALAIPATARVVGMVGRFAAQKDHRTFIEAAGRLHMDMPDLHFILCGRGVEWGNHDLERWIDAAGIRQASRLLSERRDMPHVYPAFDVAVSSSSYGESFPNTVGEAMACGVPCVVTDVGESARIVGDTGYAVKARDSEALERALRGALSSTAVALISKGTRARARIRELYTIGPVITSYEAVYRRLVDIPGNPELPRSVRSANVCASASSGAGRTAVTEQDL
jgi:glycosyltransferase involved in cell wall biosynthesis